MVVPGVHRLSPRPAAQDSNATPAPATPATVTPEEHAAHRRKVQHDEAVRRVTSGALLGVIGVNTLAPVWGPVLMGGPGPMETAARAAVTHVQPVRGKSPLAVRLEAAQVASETKAIFADVDARLRQVDAGLERADAALGAPSGTTRAAVLERLLLAGGMDAATARRLSHDSLRSESIAETLQHVDAVLERLGVDGGELVVGLARAADQITSDKRVELAFALGSLAVLPKVSAEVLPPVARVGKALVDGFQRHEQAMNRLKYPGTGHAGIDNAGRVVGEAVDLVAHGLAFFGPAPFLKLARGADVMLILADCLAAKTAVAGSTKTLATYTDLPAEFAAFMLGALSTAGVREGSVRALAEGNATAQHLTTTATDLHRALQSGDRDALVVALQRSATTMTATEKTAIAQAIQSGVETLAVAGG
jgi:hypothetical protein